MKDRRNLHPSFRSLRTSSDGSPQVLAEVNILMWTTDVESETNKPLKMKNPSIMILSLCVDLVNKPDRDFLFSNYLCHLHYLPIFFEGSLSIHKSSSTQQLAI